MPNASPRNTPPLRRGEIDVNGHPFHVLDQGEGPAVLYGYDDLVSLLAAEELRRSGSAVTS